MQKEKLYMPRYPRPKPQTPTLLWFSFSMQTAVTFYQPILFYCPPSHLFDITHNSLYIQALFSLSIFLYNF